MTRRTPLAVPLPIAITGGVEPCEHVGKRRRLGRAIAAEWVVRDNPKRFTHQADAPSHDRARLQIAALRYLEIVTAMVRVEALQQGAQKPKPFCGLLIEMK